MYVETLRQQLVAAADSGGPESRAAVERLAPGLEAAVRLVLLEALSAAADEITSELAPGAVDVRLRGSDPEFVVTLPSYEATDDAASGSAASPTVIPAGGDEGGTSRLNLRIPEGLKAKIEEADATRGSVSQRMAGPHCGFRDRWQPGAAVTAEPGERQPEIQRMGPVTTTGSLQHHGSGVDMQTFETNQPIVVSIALSHGAVHVIASDRTDTVVSVNPSDRDRPEDIEAAARTAVDLANETLSIRQPKPGGIAAPVIGWKRRGSVDVTVELPEGSSLRADTGVASFRGDGRLGGVDVKTGAGDVRLDQTGALRVRTSTGHVSVENASGRAEIVAAGDTTLGIVTGDAHVKNLNGKTWIGRVGGDVKVKSANGDVTIDDAGRDVTVKTANGNIRLGQVARGSVTIETASGGLEIGVREGTAAWIDATTRFGRIHNNLTPADDPEPSAETVQVRARTSLGDVVITRS